MEAPTQNTIDAHQYGYNFRQNLGGSYYFPAAQRQAADELAAQLGRSLSPEEDANLRAGIQGIEPLLTETAATVRPEIETTEQQVGKSATRYTIDTPSL